MNEYLMHEIDCPTCGGEGYTETMTHLTYDGDQTWRTNECDECHGNKTVETPAKCNECGEDILASEEWVKDGDGFKCAFCSNEDDDWEDIYEEAFERVEGTGEDATEVVTASVDDTTCKVCGGKDGNHFTRFVTYLERITG